MVTYSRPGRLDGSPNHTAYQASPDGPPLVASFDNRDRAAGAVKALRAAGLGEGQVWLLVPPRVDWAALRALEHHRQDAAVATELGRALVDAGVADGPARFYEQEFAAGKSLVVVQPAGWWLRAMTVLRRHHGRDLEQIGGQLARAPELETCPPGIPLAPAVSRLTWRDVAAYYETLFDQRYGAGNATWAEYETAYHFAWDPSNDPDYRGHSWIEQAAHVRRAWQARGNGLAWEQVQGGMGDVWQDMMDDQVCTDTGVSTG
jgi:hypothetical protein